jgi:hypothetical protein|tara:strand:- start:493 stop:774 length:282 start_codon:yes stop_codon:yes gene_type:complete
VPKTSCYFIINEFVGPNKFQWTDVQLAHCQRLVEEILEPYRQIIREPGVKYSVERRDFGGTFLHLVLYNIAGNLSDSDKREIILRNFLGKSSD